MNNGNKFWNNQRTKLLVFITIVMGMALVVNLTILSDRVHDEARRQIERNSTAASELLAESVTGLVYNYQIEEANYLLDRFVKQAEFSYASIIDTDGLTFAKSGTPLQGSNHLSFRIDLVPEGQGRIGELLVHASDEAVSSAALEAFRNDAIIGSLQILAILTVVFFGTSQLIKALSRAHDQMKRQAARDSLTGLLNRRGLREALAARLKEQPVSTVGLVHIDLDRFKSINDNLGHGVGDKVLKIYADRMKSAVRDCDIVARVGGDEFLIASLVEDSREHVTNLANRVVGKLNQPIDDLPLSTKIGASAGVAIYTLEDMEKFEEALSAADLALYEAKNTGRAKVVHFNSALRDRHAETETLLKDVAEGVENGEFEPWFQPQVDSVTGRIEAFEALARWNSPKRGLVEPSLFLSAARSAGLIAELDRQMFTQALDGFVKLRSTELPSIRLGINISSSRLRQENLVQELTNEVRKVGLRNTDISLEILETIFLDNPGDLMADTIRMLELAGFRIELDDFGTGRASVENLTHFPVSRLKIDRHFTSGVDFDVEKQKITKALFSFARELNISALAEGVETKGEAEFLRNIGCTTMQGFHFANPMPLEEAIEWSSKYVEEIKQPKLHAIDGDVLLRRMMA